MTEIPKWRDAENNVDWDATAEEFQIRVDEAIAEWRESRPWITDEWLAWWTSLDHSRCSQYADEANRWGIEVVRQLPAYVLCHSMHCPDCNQATGGQGHMSCPERKRKQWASNFTLTDGGQTFAVVEDEGGDLYWGYGHVDPDEFAAEVARWLRHVGNDPEGEPFTGVEHLWATFDNDDNERFHVVEDTGPMSTFMNPKAFPVTRLVL